MKILAGLMLLAISIPVAAADHPAQKQKKICRSERETGSRMTTTTCLTEQQWRERDASGQEGDGLGGQSKMHGDVTLRDMKGSLQTGAAPR